MWHTTPSQVIITVWMACSVILASHGAAGLRTRHVKRQSLLQSYDFVVVGGGTAGLVLADRLTESGTQSVLVLEAGGLPTEVAAYETPGGNQFLGGSAIDWAFTTVPQTSMDNRILTYHRGRCLGGSSAINGLYYGRGSSTIYDKWEALGNPGWSWQDVYPLFINSTTWVGDPSKSTDSSFETHDPAAYGNGPLQIGWQGYVPDSGVAFIKACTAVNIPIVTELNTGNGVGVKQGSGTIDTNFMRSSSYDSYYMLAKNRPNLHVLARSPVVKVVFDGTTATGVVYIDEPTGKYFNATANKEVIMAGGAFHTPQIMMVSGIGPSAELAKFGIGAVHINENVGQHMNDHTSFSIMAKAQASASTTDMSSNIANLEAAQTEYYTNRTGRYTAPSGITNGFQKLSNAELESIGAGAVVDANITNQAHIEYLYESIFYPGGPTPFYIEKGNESYISITASNLAALSRGSVTLGSSSLSAAPIIDPNYYSNPADEMLAVQAFKYLRKILAFPELAALTIGPDNGEISPGAAVQSDEDILAYIKTNTIPNWHASGTMRMLPETDGGVVDARLRVYGVNNLRVIDCSIIPFLPDANIQASVFMIGEKGAQMIKEDHGF